MKPKIVKALSCSQCGHLFPNDERGKILAERCCLCFECQKNPSSYTGVGTKCSSCHDKEVLNASKKALEHAQKQYEEAQKKVMRGF